MRFKSRRSGSTVKSKAQTLREAIRAQGLLAQVSSLEAIDRLKLEPRQQRPKSLIPHGFKVYSQNDEDGIIREIFNRIGVTNQHFIEFGVGAGEENNTLALMFDGWQGLWIEGSETAVRRIKAELPSVVSSGRLRVVEAFITADNINQLIRSAGFVDEEIDFLSVDVDGNDYHIFDAITCVNPRVVVIEYNSKFVPPTEYCMDYQEGFVWQGDDCFGASLKFLETHLRSKGYSLVGCNLTGVNAFFVRDDLVADKFLEPFTAENHHEPARFFLKMPASGHKPSLQTLNTSLTAHNLDSAP